MAMLPAQAPPERESVQQIRSRRAGGLGRGLAGRSDERLVQIAREGDERAFAALYERHSAAILRYCRSLLRSPQEAEDVKQEVFVLAISALRRGAEPDAFRPWLYRVAHNACMSSMRIRRPVLVADNGVLVGPAAVAEPVDGHREELRQLLDDIGRLPDVQRGALLLREMDGFSYEQVGEVMGLPPSTVRASIFRARRTLQGLAEARDADCEAIQSELCELADRRGRRARHITSHLDVCSSCREFRDGLRRRPAVLGAVDPIAPAGAIGALLAVKGKLLGGAATGGGAGAAIAGGGSGAAVAKISAVVASSVALLAGAGLEAERVIERSHERGAAVVTRSAGEPLAPRGAEASGAGAVPASLAAAVPADPEPAGRAPSATPRRASTGGGPSRARTREQVAAEPGAAGPRAATGPATTPAAGDAPSAVPAPADDHSSSSDDERGSSGRGGDERDRSGRDDDDARARPRVRERGNSGSGSQPRDHDGDDQASAPRAPSSSGSSGSGGSTPPPPAPDDGPSPPNDSGSSGPIPPAVPPDTDGDDEPAPTDQVPPTDDSGDEPPADQSAPPEPPAGDRDATGAPGTP